jgi:hypothetical protein
MGHEWNEAGPATAASLPEATALERVTAAHRAVGAEDLGEVVQERLRTAGVFPVTRQDNGTLMVENGSSVPAGVHDLLAARFQQERTARLALEQELEDARRLVGQGPFIVVKADSLNAIADGGEIRFKLAHGNGVTRHMIPALLSLAWQSITEAQPEPETVDCSLCTATSQDLPAHMRDYHSASGSQGDTVRLPETPQEWVGSAGPIRPAEKPQEGMAWERSHGYPMEG